MAGGRGGGGDPGRVAGAAAIRAADDGVQDREPFREVQLRCEGLAARRLSPRCPHWRLCPWAGLPDGPGEPTHVAAGWGGLAGAHRGADAALRPRAGLRVPGHGPVGRVGRCGAGARRHDGPRRRGRSEGRTGCGAGLCGAALVDGAAALLAAAPPQAIVYAFTSSSRILGGEADAAPKARLGARTGGIPVAISASAACPALRSIGAGRVALVHSPGSRPTSTGAAPNTSGPGASRSSTTGRHRCAAASVRSPPVRSTAGSAGACRPRPRRWWSAATACAPQARSRPWRRISVARCGARIRRRSGTRSASPGPVLRSATMGSCSRRPCHRRREGARYADRRARRRRPRHRGPDRSAVWEPELGTRDAGRLVRPLRTM
jgi:hypothetical protein